MNDTCIALSKFSWDDLIFSLLQSNIHEKYVQLSVSLPLRILWGFTKKTCTCAPAMVTKYQKRISGPLLDRIDIHIEVPRVDYKKLSGNRLGETSESIRQRVQSARDIQNKRFSNGESKDIVCNADMRVGEVRRFCQLQAEGQSLMRSAMSQLNLSARAYHRILKLSRTIADLAGSEEIQSAHLAEALHASQSSKDHAGVIKKQVDNLKSFGQG